MAIEFSESQKAHLTHAVDLLVKSHARDLPFDETILWHTAQAAVGAGYSPNVATFIEKAKNAPFSQLVGLLKWVGVKYYSSSIPGEPIVVPGDPTLSNHAINELMGPNYSDEHAANFLLAGARSGANNVLTWTYPPPMLTDGIVNTPGFKGLFLQRSSREDNLPNPGVFIYQTSNTAPPVDANWTTIMSWNQSYLGSNAAPTGYTDSAAAAYTIYAYRVILILTSEVEGIGKVEIDWNTIKIVPVFQLVVHPAFDGDFTNPRLTWNAPNFT